MSGAKALARSEWDRMFPEDAGGSSEPRSTTLSFDEVCRVRATIERGGFMPEPISEADVLQTLPGHLGGTRFEAKHLPAALTYLRGWIGDVSVEASSIGVRSWALRVQGARYYCRNLVSVARTAAAIAYRRECSQQGIDADVKHLLGETP